MKRKPRWLAERIREERELQQYIGLRSFRKKRLKRIKSPSKRVIVRRKIRRKVWDSDLRYREVAVSAWQGCGEAAQSHLAAGYPIYYRERDTTPGVCIKEYPDGHRELVRFDATGEIVICEIDPSHD